MAADFASDASEATVRQNGKEKCPSPGEAIFEPRKAPTGHSTAPPLCLCFSCAFWSVSQNFSAPQSLVRKCEYLFPPEAWYGPIKHLNALDHDLVPTVASLGTDGTHLRNDGISVT